MMRYSLVLLCLLFCSCNKSGEELEELNSCSKGEWVDKVIHVNGIWHYAFSGVFADGGSVALGLINGNGEIVYVFFDYSAGTNHEYRRCYIQRSYNDSGAVEIVRGSDLESSVISIIKNARLVNELRRSLPDRNEAIEILQKRDLNLRFSLDAEPTEPIKRMSIRHLPVPPTRAEK